MSPSPSFIIIIRAISRVTGACRRQILVPYRQVCRSVRPELGFSAAALEIPLRYSTAVVKDSSNYGEPSA
jgi:hypothetical protein